MFREESLPVQARIAGCCYLIVIACGAFVEIAFANPSWLRIAPPRPWRR
jgi:hypothetical protein